jgi:hypothetical protein
LYNFQHQPLDVKQFETLAAYMNKYGLNRNSTVIYLCTPETNIEVGKKIKTENTVKILPVVAKTELEPIPITDSPVASTSGNSYFKD